MPDMVIYTRISDADRETQTATRRQESSCRAFADARGWRVIQTYEDVDLSAFRAGIERPAYEEMLGAIRDGLVQGVLVWKLDRLMRRPAEFERFWSICEDAGVVLASATEPIDTSTGLGLALVRILVTFANLESATKSERLRAKYREMAESGRAHPGGMRAFGLNRKRTRVIPTEAELIRDAARRIIAGDTTYAIARDWRIHGVLTARKKAWLPQHVRNMLLRDYLVGDRIYHGKIVAKGAWPAILDRKTFELVGAILRDPARTTRGSAETKALTGLLLCNECRTKMNSASGYLKDGRRQRAYACPGPPYGCGRRRVVAERLEAWIAEKTFVYLDSQRLHRRMAEDDASFVQSPRIAQLVDELNQLAVDRYRYKVMTRPGYFAARRTLLRQLQRERALVEDQRHLPTLKTLVGQGEATRREWVSMSTADRRRILAAAIDHIIVGPAPTHRRFRPARFKIHWRL